MNKSILVYVTGHLASCQVNMGNTKWQLHHFPIKHVQSFYCRRMREHRQCLAVEIKNQSHFLLPLQQACQGIRLHHGTMVQDDNCLRFALQLNGRQEGHVSRTKESRLLNVTRLQSFATHHFDVRSGGLDVTQVVAIMHAQVFTGDL